MKKFIKFILMGILLVCPYLFVAYLTAQVMGPDGNYYTNNCSIPGVGNIERVNVWFDDFDGDCVSDNWYVEYTMDDGDVERSSDEDWRSLGIDPTLNFGAFDCCDSIPLGFGCSCDWSYDPVNEELVINCHECGEFD